MLDFSTLTQARQGLHSSDEQRHQQAAEQYLQGRQCIREALKYNVDKQMLKQASGHFSKGIQLHYKNPSNYLGMGFLFLLLSQPNEALPYIKSALEIEPNSTLGQELLQQAQETQRPNKQPSSATPQMPTITQPKTHLDYDDLYDATEAAILLFLKQMMSDEVLGLKPSLHSPHFKLVQTKLTFFQQKTQAFQAQLKILDEEIDVMELRQHLSTVDKALQRTVHLATLFEEFHHIHQDIQKHCTLVAEIITESQSTNDPADIAVLEENLEILLDHCDSVADRLDAFEAKRVDISPLQPPYERYAEQLEHFQEVLEETIERLHP